MSTIVTRAGKGSPLTNGQVDANFTNLNTDKAELSGATFTGDVSVPNISVADDIRHSGDSDTYISFEANNQTFYAGGTRAVDIAAGSLVVNEGSVDYDFRVESNGNANMLFVDGGNNRVGVGMSAPLEPLHTTGRILSTTTYGSATQRIGTSIGQNGNTRADIDFRRWTGASTNHGVGMIEVADTGIMRFYADSKTSNTPATTERMQIQSDGKIRLGNSGDHVLVDITGSNAALQLVDNNQSNPPTLRGNGPNFTIENGGVERMRIDTGVVFNETGIDQDFRVESNGNANMLFVDGGVNKVYVGASSAGANGILQVTGGIGLTGNAEIRQSTNGDGSTLRFLGTQLVIANTNANGYNYSGGGLIASVSPSGSAITLDVGAVSTSGHRLKVINAGNGVAGSLQYLSGTTPRFHVDSATGITTFTKSGGGNIRIAETASRYVEIMGYAEGSANGSTMAFHTTQTGTSTSTERMRIDSSGNVLVGTTDTFPGGGDTNTGVSLTSSGAVVASRDGDFAARFNRKSSDGEIIGLNKNGSAVGSIGSSNGGERLYVVNDSTGLSFLGDFSKILPCDSAGAPRDAAIDLGQASGGRFKDLHLSGTAIAASFATTAGGTLTTAAGNDLNLVFPANRSLFIKEGSATHLTINNAGNVGIGVAPTFSAGGSRRLLQLTNGASGGLVAMGNNASESENPRIFSDADNLGFATSTTGGGIFQFFTANTERMRIDSSGNVLVSKTSSALSAAGIALMSNDQVRVTTSGDNPLELNRLSNDGDIIRFYKANTQVGSIGNVSNNLEVNSQGGTLKISTIGTERYGFDVEQFYPAVDGTTNLGIGNLRFDDVFLSGGVHLGGTGTANKLDSYEEGTWDPEIYYQNSTDLGNATNTTQTGYYTKIGRLVILDFRLIWNITGSIANDNIGVKNLPFVGDSDTFSTAGVGYARNNSTTINTLIIIRPADGGTLALCDSGDQIGNLGNEFGAGNAKEIRATLTYFTDA